MGKVKENIEELLHSGKDKSDEIIFKASDAKKAGISYRQLNDWESKGALPTQRDREAGWRRFSARELFVLLICRTLRQNFGVPVEKLTFITSFMLQKNNDHFGYALGMIQRIGFNFYILTDLQETFMMDCDMEIMDLFRLGFFKSDSSNNYLLIHVNPIINQVLALKEIPPLKTDETIYDRIRDFEHQKTAHDVNELEVLKLLRTKRFSKVIVHTTDGKIEQADTEEEVPPAVWDTKCDAIIKLVKEKKYQTLTIQVRDGKLVRLNRKSPIKFGHPQKKSET